MDVNQLGMFAFSVLVIGFAIGKSISNPAPTPVQDNRTPVRFDDGSVVMIDPNDPIDIATLKMMQEQSDLPIPTANPASSSINQARDISQFDWSAKDFEVRTSEGGSDD